MDKKTWVAPRVSPLAAAKDAELGTSGTSDLVGKSVKSGS
jgi:hypothetical protein